MELRSAKTLARDFELSAFTIRRLGYRGLLKPFKCGRAVRYDPAELAALMEKQRKSEQPGAKGIAK